MARLILLLLLLWPGAALGAATYATVTGTLTKPGGAACASCKVSFLVPRTQTISGTTFPAGTITTCTSSSTGAVPSTCQVARTLTVDVTVGTEPPYPCTIPDAATMSVSACGGTVPSVADINDIPGCLETIKGGIGACLATPANGCAEWAAGALSSTGAACGSGGGGGGAPTDATYITRTANATLSAETAMGSLGAGLVHNTATTGIPTIFTGSSCTNQFPRTMNASGSWTCSKVQLATDMGDVTITSADEGNFLRHNGTAWVDAFLIPGDLPASPGNCTSGEFVQGVNAGLVLNCAAPPDNDTTYTAGAGLSLSGTDFRTASTETDFITVPGSFSCGSGTKGRMSFFNDNVLTYCDDTPVTPQQRYAALGSASGEATGLSCTSCVTLPSEITGRLPYANLVASTAASKIIGRTDASAGDWQEITLGTNLAMSGTTLNATGGGGASNSFETQATPSGTSPVADSATDTLTWAVGGIVTMTGNSATDTITVSATEVDGSTTNEMQNIFQTMTTPSGTSPVADTTTDSLTFAVSGIATVTGNSTTDTITIGATEVDGSTTNEIQNLYATINAPSGTDPVAGAAADTLNLAASGIATVTGDSTTDTITIGAVEVDGSVTNEAPIAATYITRTADSTLSAETAMGALATGITMNTTTTGVPTIYGGTTCTNQFPRSLDASGAATCASVSLTADVTGDLPLSNVAQSAAASRLLGRGDSGAGDWEPLTMQGGLSIGGTILTLLGQEWAFLDAIPDAVDGSTNNGLLWGPSVSITGTVGTTSNTRGIYLAPTILYDDASGAIINNYAAVEGGGTFIVSGAGTQASSWALFNATSSLSVTLANKVPPTPNVFRSGITLDYAATSGTGNMTGSQNIFYDNTVFKNTDAGGTFTVAAPNSFVSSQQYIETAGALNITTGRGFYAMNPTVTGTPQVTTSVGVDVDRPTRAATPAGNIGIRNSGSEVWAPNTQALTDEFTINPVAGIIGITATTDPIDDGTTAITDGTDGQVMIIVNVDETSAQTITFTTGANLALSVSPTDLDKCDSITVMFLSTFGIWVEIGRANLVC